MDFIKCLFFLLRTPGFSAFIERFGYVGILLWFLTIDQVTPIPEEVSLLIVGYLSAHHVFHPAIAGVFCLVGFLIVDTIYFFLSKKGNSWIKKKTRGSFAPIESLKSELKKNTAKAILILCFIPRMRMFAPILAGSMGLPFKKFLLYNSIALTLFTTVYVALGFIFNASLQKIIKQTKGLQNIIFFATLLIVTVVIIFIVRGRKKKSMPAGGDT
jgi:membrane protein DedA with SNARE-associated domain